MQQLHLVGFTTEHDGLIFSARKGAKSGGFLVALDEALYDTIDEASRLREGDGEARRANRRSMPKVESALSPRDIQRRLRAGRSIAHVAAEAGVGEDWIMRFAVPILAEQALLVAKAQSLVFAKARLGPSGRPLGESVWWNVADKGALMAEDTFDQCWTALHMRDSAWVVRFDFVNRKKRQRAEWEVDIREGTLVARNRLAAELGYVEPGRRGRPPAPLPPAAKPPVKKAPAPVKSASRGVAVATRAAKRPVKKKAVTRRPATKKRAVKKATAKKTAAKKTAAKRTVARKAATRKAAPRKTAGRKATTRKATVATRRPAKRAPAKRAPAKRAAAKRSAPKRTAPKRTAGKRTAAKRQPAKRATRPRPLQAPQFQTPAFDAGEPTRAVTIRAPRASEPTEATPVPVEPISVAAEPAPLPPPPVLTSTPAPGRQRETAEQRRFSRLRRRRPPGG